MPTMPANQSTCALKYIKASFRLAMYSNLNTKQYICPHHPIIS